MTQTWGKEKYSNPALSEDTLEIIGQIERKALGEIIHLQKDRDALKKEKDLLIAELEKAKNYIREQSKDSKTFQQQQQQHLQTLSQQNAGVDPQ